MHQKPFELTPFVAEYAALTLFGLSKGTYGSLRIFFKVKLKLVFVIGRS